MILEYVYEPQELASLSLLLKYEKKCLELAYESAIAGALRTYQF